MKISLFGAGYTGLVTAACLAHENHHVTCIDIDEPRIQSLNDGVLPIYEPGLEKLIQTALAREQIQFSTDTESLETAELVIITVGTPINESGITDLSALWSVCDQLKGQINENTLVVIKSTVPVGTTTKFNAKLKNSVAYMPEFLREANAVKDFQHPDRIVVGVSSSKDEQILKSVFKPFIRHDEQWIVMEPASAELTKYAANAMLACRISFMNEMANLAQALGADIKQIQRGVGSDRRIGPQFINSGIGFGGSCLPKNLDALKEIGEKNDVELPMISAIQTANDRQLDVAFELISELCFGKFIGKTLAIWGLAFKSDTDDIRESPALKLVDRLLKAGATIRAYDQFAEKNVRKMFGETLQFILCNSPEECLKGCDGLLVLTESEEFVEFPAEKLAKALSGSWIFDGKNSLSQKQYMDYEIQYCGIGRIVENANVDEFA